MESFHEKVKSYVNKVSNKLGHKKSNKYYIFILVTVIGYCFFLSSGKIFKDTSNIKSTEIYHKSDLQNISIQLIKREYNPNSNVVQLIIKTDYRTERIDTKLNVDVKEKSNINQLLETKVIRLNQDYTVILIQLPKKWTTISVGLKEELENENISSSDGVKIYVDKRDIDINNSLIEKNRDEYLAEVTEEEMNIEQKNILKIDKDIEEKELKIKNLNIQIGDLEEKKKYQTEDEKINTNTNISSKQGLIVTTENEIEKLKEQKEKTNEKIKMLEEKIRDIKKNK